MVTNNTTTPTKLDEFIALEELAKLLGVTRGVVSRWRALGLPAIKVGIRVYFREASVAAWLAAQETVRPRTE